MKITRFLQFDDTKIIDKWFIRKLELFETNEK